MCEAIQQMMNNSMQQGVQLGKKQGERNMQLRIARQMLAAKLPLQQISEMTALSMSELQKLQNTGN